jgi:hypothetical protein
MKQYRLPQQLDELEWVAQHVFVPRIEAIMEAMLDEHGTVTVKRASTSDSPGMAFADVVFGRKDAPNGRWTAFLVRVELDPRSNLVCIQAGEHPQMNRQFAFAEKGWNSQLIEGFEWVLSDSMRHHLRIRGGGETPSA